MSQHCPKCSLRVAPSDPERVQVGIELYHQPCLAKVRQEKEQQQRQQPKDAKQRYFRFRYGLTVH